MDDLNTAHEKGVVLGLRGVSGIVNRLDIDVMLTEQPDTFNLFLIALMELQGVEGLPWQHEIPDGYSFRPNGQKVDMKMSWFQLAGIHGLPDTPWDGEGNKGWYCNHGEPTFGLWHRPYLAMMEQTLFRQIANIAQRFAQSTAPGVSDTVKQKYLDAAKLFRLPYWDYYRPRGYEVTLPGVTQGKTTKAPYDYHAPQILSMPQVMIRRLPDNELVHMANPLLRFQFTSEQSETIYQVNDSEGLLWAEKLAKVTSKQDGMNWTIRHGGSDEAAAEAMNIQLNRAREKNMGRCLAMIEDEIYKDFRVFSCKKAWQEENQKPEALLAKPAGSIEAFHDDYHDLIGEANGHMGHIPVAAFDPIFWIHHCQIDRLFAIWQAVNPPTESGDGPTHWFKDLPDEDQGQVKKDMLPFRVWPQTETSSEKTHWTADEARQTKTFGYSYPDIADGKTPKQVREDFVGKYNWSRRTTTEPFFGSPPDDMKPLEVANAQVFQYTSGVPSLSLLKRLGTMSLLRPMHQQLAMTAMTDSVGYSDEWYIDAVVEKMATNGSFAIIYVIGNIHGASSQEWSILPGFAGSSVILAAPREVCDNCARQDERAQLVRTTNPITPLLLDYVKAGKLRSMHPEDVKLFLTVNLKWRVRASSGKVLDPRDMAKHHSLRLGISRKQTPVPVGSADNVRYDTYPDVIKAIIENSSKEWSFSEPKSPTAERSGPDSSKEFRFTLNHWRNEKSSRL